MALRSNALTTVAACKSQLDIPTANTDQDSFIERLINSASQQIDRYCNRRFVSTSYVEIFDGNRSNQLLLGNMPVTALSELNVDSLRVFGSSTIVAATEYGRTGNIITKNSGNWGNVRQSIRVSYTAGFTEVPADVENACIMLVELYYRMKNDRRIGRESQSKAGEDITFVDGLPKAVTDVLDNYKIIPMVEGSSSEMV